MINLTSWTGQESAEAAAMQGNALIHTKSKARSSKSLKVEEGQEPAPSNRLHIDLASDVIQVCERLGLFFGAWGAWLACWICGTCTIACVRYVC
jgi:hypothetical protein